MSPDNIYTIIAEIDTQNNQWQTIINHIDYVYIMVIVCYILPNFFVSTRIYVWWTEIMW